jgi:Fur family ferric uptake transcriptional regulator
MRLTRQRKRLLDLLDQGDKPLSAETLMQRLPDGFMNLSTIYRNLDHFHQAGCSAKASWKDAVITTATKRHQHFMICLGCQKMVPVDCRLESMADQVAARTIFKSPITT